MLESEAVIIAEDKHRIESRSSRKEELAHYVETILRSTGSPKTTAPAGENVEISSQKIRINPPFPAPDIVFIDAVEELHSAFRENLIVSRGLSESSVYQTKAWLMDIDKNTWHQVYLILTPHSSASLSRELRIYQTPRDDPLSPQRVAFTTSANGNPIETVLCRKHGKPHCVYLFDGEFTIWLCFRSIQLAIEFANQINPKKAFAIPGSANLEKCDFEAQRVLKMAKMLPSFNTSALKSSNKIILAIGGESSVALASYLLILDLQTSVWAPFLVVLTRSGTIKIYEDAECEPENSSGTIYLTKGQSGRLNVVFPKVQMASVLPQWAELWESCAFSLQDDVGDYDFCCSNPAMRDSWTNFLISEYSAEVTFSPVKLTDRDIVFDQRASTINEDISTNDHESEDKFDDSSEHLVIRESSPTDNSDRRFKFPKFTFGFSFEDAFSIGVIPEYDSERPLGFIQHALVSKDRKSWELKVVSLNLSQGVVEINEIVSSGGLETTDIGINLIAPVSTWYCDPRTIHIGRCFQKPYCLYDDSWALCFRAPQIVSAWINVISPELGRMLPSSDASPILPASKLTPSDVISMAKALASVTALPAHLEVLSSVQVLNWGNAVLHDEQTELWTPFFLLLTMNLETKKKQLSILLDSSSLFSDRVLQLDLQHFLEAQEELLRISPYSSTSRADVSEHEWRNHCFVLQSLTEQSLRYCFCVSSHSSRSQWLKNMFSTEGSKDLNTPSSETPFVSGNPLAETFLIVCESAKSLEDKHFNPSTLPPRFVDNLYSGYMLFNLYNRGTSVPIQDWASSWSPVAVILSPSFQLSIFKVDFENKQEIEEIPSAVLNLKSSGKFTLNIPSASSRMSGEWAQIGFSIFDDSKVYQFCCSSLESRSQWLSHFKSTSLSEPHVMQQ
jgi:hypothetical protein